MSFVQPCIVNIVHQIIVDHFSRHRKELQLLLDLREKEHQKFKTDPSKLKGWLTTGEYRISPTLDPGLVAANAVTASAILNSDAFLTKR